MGINLQAGPQIPPERELETSLLLKQGMDPVPSHAPGRRGSPGRPPRPPRQGKCPFSPGEPEITQAREQAAGIEDLQRLRCLQSGGSCLQFHPQAFVSQNGSFSTHFFSYLPLPVSFPIETTAKQQVLLCSVSNPIPSAQARNGNHKSSSWLLRACPGEEKNSSLASKPFYCSLVSVTFSPGFTARPRGKL